MRHGQQEAARAADGQQEDELGEHGPSYTVLSCHVLAYVLPATREAESCSGSCP
ncbi:hypothetical protein EMIHUDRAFT_207980 [Emiliania huxleyi CCMP1516]|uniref:Uncharacterized protein n=2 Tax=Emiliania huxleyi TaxID=2903 RepID=A0A0D3JBQ6_EMIH1|nr:hypothetical protein EMIHUDRAFT_207980 [Emiliania huxleyi CCMP1516]EOD20941.1 hypothetical protein EMIHUDRAFT_207980 [Emiliania huxleyi CCMP1516]|eukprot:XP_005773370.1 hypothetical protein EMIHUDRAFT_207980 [Emiliania huxleyi CCMP1516]